MGQRSLCAILRWESHPLHKPQRMGHPPNLCNCVVNGLEITVIYVELDAGERRIISAWRSEPHERREYWKSIKRLSQ